MSQNTLTQIFDLVASHRQKGWVFSTFTPLSKERAKSLKTLLATALGEEKASTDRSFREKLLAASGTIETYESMPENVLLRVSSGIAGPDGRKDTLTDPGVLKSFRNQERDKVLTGMQRKLYKALR